MIDLMQGDCLERMSKAKKEALSFMNWFENEYPEFINQFGEVSNFFDSNLDVFQIKEIQDAYIEYKDNQEPMKMYFGWSK